MHVKDAKGILSARNGINVYRGCTHGCIYCDSRSRCYQMDHDFEDVEVKRNAPQLLEAALRKKRSRCMVGTGAMTDPYIPLELELGVTRKCMEVIERHGCGLAIQTKSDRILRDLDLLKAINCNAKCVVQMTLTTHDEQLCRIVEPNVCTTKRRVETLNIMRDNGIPTVVWLSPLLPFLNDTEQNLRGILEGCFEANVHGILNFGMGLTLREGNREYFYARLDEHFPGLSRRYDSTYGGRYEITSANSPALMKLFHEECRKHGVCCDNDQIFDYLRAFPQDQESQLTLY